MVERIKSATQRNIPFWVCLSVSIALIVAGFLVPPTGKIDGSVLTALGELFAYPALYTLWLAIRNGGKAHVRHGKTSLSVGSTDDDNQPPKPYQHDDTCDEEPD